MHTSSTNYRLRKGRKKTNLFDDLEWEQPFIMSRTSQIEGRVGGTQRAFNRHAKGPIFSHIKKFAPILLSPCPHPSPRLRPPFCFWGHNHFTLDESMRPGGSII